MKRQPCSKSHRKFKIYAQSWSMKIFWISDWLSRSVHIQLLKNLFVVFLICFFLHRYVQNRSDIILFGATKDELSWSRCWCIRIVRSGKNCMRFCLESSYQVTNLAFKSFCFFRLPHSNVCFIANQDFSMSSNLNFRNLKFCNESASMIIPVLSPCSSQLLLLGF